MSKKWKIIYWSVTAVFCLLALFSATMYFMKYEMVYSFFKGFGYPTYLIYPLAIAKLLGVVAIVSRKSVWLKEWAYAGFFFDFLLAFFAHYMISDGGEMMATIGIVFVLLSYFLEKKAFPNSN